MKKTISRILIISAIVIGGLQILAVIASIISMKAFMTKPSDITDTSMSLSISYSENGGSFSSSLEDKEALDLQWYETVEEALKNDRLIEESGEYLKGIDYKKDNAIELLQIQTDNYLTVFYTLILENGTVGRISYVIMKIEDGRFSQPFMLDALVSGPEKYCNDIFPKLYDCDDGIVFYLEQELVIGGTFGTGENRIPVCFGVWDDESEIRSLTIAGIAPEIIPVAAKEETRYFWYIENMEWADRLREVDWSDYTYGEIIDLLEIEYEPST